MHHNHAKYMTFESQHLSSPSGRLSLSVGVDSETTVAWYELRRDDHVVIERSLLSLFDTDERNLLSVSEPVEVQRATFDETWEQPWGEQRYVRNNYNELSIHSAQSIIRFRLFDDSLGFRFELQGEGSVTIARESTEFSLDAKTTAWWIPALRQNHYEHLYQKTLISDLDISHTPLALELPTGEFLAIHEAALYNYGAMNVMPSDKGLVTTITPLADATLTQATLPFTMPWRTIIVADSAPQLTTSRIMLNLNEPTKIADTSWIKPTKFMGIWWGMFIGHFTWESGDRHGATTANAFRYINAAKKLGIPALLIEGWNVGWDGDWMQNGDKMNLMLPYPDFDIKAITTYAASQGIEIVGHHETSGNVAHYEWQLPEAYDYYKHLGVNYIKTGYVSGRMNGQEYHSSQSGVNHYQKTVGMAAERKIMLDIHEPVRGTGIERTWPNLMSREGAMGQEYEGGAVSPEHTTVLPYTRMLSGPLDYTPGLFNLKGTARKVRTTLAKQLAFYVTMYSPMQMVADLPEHYENQPAFQFIKDVPVNWDVTVPLDGAIGDFFVVARKDRDSDDWYVGAVSDEEQRTVIITLDFLTEHVSYRATVYKDASDAHWHDNPEAYEITEQPASHGDTMTLILAPGGGAAIRITPTGETSLPYPS